MVFGKIEYLNLLPFHVFMKKFTKNSQQSMSMSYYRGVPSQINKKFISHKVDAAFISSIKAKKYRHVNLGIIAKREVLSVLVTPHEKHTIDDASATSNILAKVLNLQGEVIIGDRALKYYLSHGEHVDLALEWHKKHNLPFVFALLCFHKNREIYLKIEKKFIKQKVKIPHYILKESSLRTGICEKDILNYLKKISYNFDAKASRGLKKFYKLSSELF